MFMIFNTWNIISYRILDVFMIHLHTKILHAWLVTTIQKRERYIDFMLLQCLFTVYKNMTSEKAAYVYYSYRQKKKMFCIEFQNPKWCGGNFTSTSKVQAVRVLMVMSGVNLECHSVCTKFHRNLLISSEDIVGDGCTGRWTHRHDDTIICLSPQ